MYQELINEDDYNRVRSDEKFYLDLKTSDSKINLFVQLKNSATKKLRVRVWAYFLGECLYVLSRQGLTLKHKTYSIAQEDGDFLE